MAQVTWTGPANRDLHEIVEYIANDSKVHADSFASKLRQAVGRLAEFPESGRPIYTFPQGSIRELVVGSYRVLHLAMTGHVFILAVVHGARR